MQHIKDKRFPILNVTLDTADPPISTLLRKLYAEYAQRVGEAEALSMWHKLRSDAMRGAHAYAANATETQLLTDKLRELDRTEEMMREFTEQRDALFSAELEPMPQPKRDRCNFWEPVSIAFTLALLMAIGVIGGLIWQMMQRPH